MPRRASCLRVAFVVLGSAFGAACGGGGGGGDPAPSAALVALVTSSGDVVPAFDPATLGYTLYVGEFATSATFWPTALDPGAVITVNGNAVASGAESLPVDAPEIPGSLPEFALIDVTASDGTTRRSYSVRLARTTALPVQQAYAKEAKGLHAGDALGTSVAISMGIMVAGAPLEASASQGVDGNDADTSAPAAGAAFVYQRAGTSWSNVAYLKAHNTDAGDHFGHSVDTYGGTIVVGAPMEASADVGTTGDGLDDDLPGAGAVYVFQRVSGAWAQVAYLKAPHPDVDDHFGHAVAIHKDVIVVGAPGEAGAGGGVGADATDDGAPQAGAAYVYVRSGGSWVFQAYLKASHPDAEDLFGTAVAVHEGRIVVGAPQEDGAGTGVTGDPADDSWIDTGAAYSFVRTGGTWSQDAYLKASVIDDLDGFGSAVSCLDGIVVVGAPFEDSSANGIDGNASDDSAMDAGAVYAFVRLLEGGPLTFYAYVKAHNSGPGDRFGAAVSIGSGTLAVGAPGESGGTLGLDLAGSGTDDAQNASGAAYAVRFVAGHFMTPGYLKASNTGLGDEYGTSIDLDGDTICIGAPGEDSAAAGVNGIQNDESAPEAGAVYVVRY